MARAYSISRRVPPAPLIGCPRVADLSTPARHVHIPIHLVLFSLPLALLCLTSIHASRSTRFFVCCPAAAPNTAIQNHPLEPFPASPARPPHLLTAGHWPALTLTTSRCVFIDAFPSVSESNPHPIPIHRLTRRRFMIVSRPPRQVFITTHQRRAIPGFPSPHLASRPPRFENGPTIPPTGRTAVLPRTSIISNPRRGWRARRSRSFFDGAATVSTAAAAAAATAPTEPAAAATAARAGGCSAVPPAL